ncbi:MAG: hypothetical protein A6F70_08300 [Cycloclasticus sp. symbiont of Bathymodiolus heckerae]|nr:MAG: hypothetical protein A6F70_08300 [Cycloclasticus sp. symbiont of Bathymodiolus heckerae]
MANVGTVQSVSGIVKAIAEDGTERVLRVGDKVAENEKIITGSGVIVIAFTDGTVMDLGSNSSIVLNDDVLNQEGAQTAQSRSAAEDEVAALQEALTNNPNFDPANLPATAAGTTAGGDGGNNGHSVVSVDYLNPEAPVEAGFDTIGISQEFLQPDEELPPVIEGDVTVAVSVSVQVEVGVDIEDEPNPDDEPPYVPEDFPGADGESVVVSGNGAIVLEGTDDGDDNLGDEYREVTFILSLNKVFGSDVTVTFQLQPVAGGDGSEYGLGNDWVDGTLAPQQVVIPAGTTEFPVDVSIKQDHLDESNGVFNIVLLSAESEGGTATINPGADTAVITIFDDDTTPEANPDTNWVQAEPISEGYKEPVELFERVDGDGGGQNIAAPVLQESYYEGASTSGNVLNNVDHEYDPDEDVEGDERPFQDAADTDEDGDSLTVTGVIAHGDDGALGGGDDTVGTIGDPLTGKWGTLTLQADGSYVYVAGEETSELTNGQEVTDQFTYTVTDTYNQPQTTTLTITIFGGDSGVEISGLTPALEGGDVLVDEDELDNDNATGSEASKANEEGEPTATDSDTFTISAPDGVGSLTIDGHAIITNGVFAATSFITSGLSNTLSVTAYDADTGEITYTYTLLDNEAHPNAGDENNIFENLNVYLEDTDGDSTSDTLSVQIVDDIPTAVADTNNVTEGDSTSGNVLTDGVDDEFGADGPVTTAPVGGVVGVAFSSDTGTDVSTGVGSAIAGDHGTLTLNADGSYEYVSDANDITSDQTDVFVYTIEDADGDLSTVTLTIEVDNVSLSADNDTITVDEDGLPVVGSDSVSNSETAGGTLAVAGAVSYAFASGENGTGNNGTLTLNENGTYSYTLTSAVASGVNPGENTVNDVEVFNYTATDADGNTVDGTITVNVVDDIPSISSPDGEVLNADGESLDGIIDFDLGADGAGGIDLSLITTPVGLTSNGLAVQYVVEDSNNDGFDELRAFTTSGDVFLISQDGSDSQYSLDMLDTLDLTSTFTNSFSNGVTGGGPAGSIDFSTQDGATNFVIRLTSPDDVNNSAGKIGVDNQSMNGGETLTIEFLDEVATGDYFVNGITLGMFNFGGSDAFTYTLYNGNTVAGSGTVDTASLINGDSQPLLATDNGQTEYDRIEITVSNTTDSGGFKFDDISGQGSSSFDAIFELGAIATDSDGDSTDAAAGTYTISIGDTLATVLGGDDDVPVALS